MGGKWEKGGRAGGFCGGLSLNETRCVVGPVRFCELLCLRFGQIWNLGRRPGICALGGQGEGVCRVEDGSAGGQRGGKNGLSHSPPSLSRLLSPSLCMCSSAPAVGLPAHSLRVTQAAV